MQLLTLHVIAATLGLLVGALCIWLSASLIRQSSSAGMFAMAILTIAVGIWSSALGMQALHYDTSWMLLWLPIIELAKGAIGGAFLAYCIDFTSRNRNVRGSSLLIGLPALLTYGLALTNPWHELWYTDAGATQIGSLLALDFTAQILKRVQQIYSFGAFLIGLLVLVLAYRNTTGPKRTALRIATTGALLICALLIAARVAEAALGRPTPILIELAMVAIAPLIILYGITRVSVFALLPLARDQILEVLDDGVVVLDTTAAIVDTNAAATRILGVREQDLILRRLDEIDPDFPDLRQLTEGATLTTRLMRIGALGERTYELHARPIWDTRSQRAGTLVRISDITSHQNAEAAVSAALQSERRLRQIAHLLGSCTNTGQLLVQMLEVTSQLAPFDLGVAALLDDDERTITSQRMRSALGDSILDGTLPRSLTPDFLELLSGSRPLLTNEYQRANHALPELIEAGITAQLSMPIRFDDKIVALLTIMRADPGRPFSREEIQALAPLPGQISAALARIQREEAEDRRLRELEALRQTYTDISAHLELATLLELIVERSIALIGVDAGMLSQYDPHTGLLPVWAGRENHPEIERRPPVRLGEGVVGTVAATRMPLIVNDLRSWEGRRQSISADAQPAAALSVPMLDDTTLIGVLTVADYSGAKQFNAHDLQVLSLFAQQATIAIQNARLYDTIRRLAQTDDLTGAWNRRQFMALAESELQRAARYPAPLAVVLVDIDHFKSVNDTYGHLAGDQALAGLVQRSRTVLRQVDIIGRYGGEEFALLLPETGLAEAGLVIERLRQAVASEPLAGDLPARVTISAGIAASGAGERRTLSDLLDQADQALYAAKRAGRNQIWQWDSAAGQPAAAGAAGQPATG